MWVFSDSGVYLDTTKAETYPGLPEAMDGVLGIIPDVGVGPFYDMFYDECISADPNVYVAHHRL